jgi:hypothetical protein
VDDTSIGKIKKKERGKGKRKGCTTSERKLERL